MARRRRRAFARATYSRFFRSWARSHGMTYSQATRDPMARAYYSFARGVGAEYRVVAWEQAGVIEYDEEEGEYRYVEQEV